jgi:hypothetical protein
LLGRIRVQQLVQLDSSQLKTLIGDMQNHKVSLVRSIRRWLVILTLVIFPVLLNSLLVLLKLPNLVLLHRMKSFVQGRLLVM